MPQHPLTARPVAERSRAGTVLPVITHLLPARESNLWRNHVERSLLWVAGMLVLSLGIAAAIQANIGLAPADLVTTGTAAFTGVELWVIVNAFAAACIAGSMLLGAKLRPATLLAALLIGPCIATCLALLHSAGLSGATPLGLRVTALFVGLALIAVGSACQISSGYGPSPFDLLAVALSDRFGWTLRKSRITLDIALIAIGFALSAAVGVGTVAMMVGVGVVLNEMHRRLTGLRERLGTQAISET